MTSSISRHCWKRFSDDNTPGHVYERSFSDNRVGTVYGYHGWGGRLVGDWAWFICDKNDIGINFQKSFDHFTRSDVAMAACERAGINR